MVPLGPQHASSSLSSTLNTSGSSAKSSSSTVVSIFIFYPALVLPCLHIYESLPSLCPHFSCFQDCQSYLVHCGENNDYLSFEVLEKPSPYFQVFLYPFLIVMPNIVKTKKKKKNFNFKPLTIF